MRPSCDVNDQRSVWSKYVKIIAIPCHQLELQLRSTSILQTTCRSLLAAKRLDGWCRLMERNLGHQMESVNLPKNSDLGTNERSPHIPPVLEADFGPRLISLNYPALKPGEMTVATRNCGCRRVRWNKNNLPLTTDSP